MGIPCACSLLTIWSHETGSTVPSRVSLLILHIHRLNLVLLSHGIPPLDDRWSNRRGTEQRLNPSRETKFSGTYGDRGIFIFPVQLTTSRIGNLTRLTHTLLYVMTIQYSILGGRTHILYLARVCINRVRLSILLVVS